MATKEMTIKSWMENGGRKEEEFGVFMGYLGLPAPLELERTRFDEFRVKGTSWTITLNYGDWINEPNYMILSNRRYHEFQVYYMNRPEEKFPFYRI